MASRRARRARSPSTAPPSAAYRALTRGEAVILDSVLADADAPPRGAHIYLTAGHPERAHRRARAGRVECTAGTAQARRLPGLALLGGGARDREPPAPHGPAPSRRDGLSDRPPEPAGGRATPDRGDGGGTTLLSAADAADDGLRRAEAGERPVRALGGRRGAVCAGLGAGGVSAHGGLGGTRRRRRVPGDPTGGDGGGQARWWVGA